MEPIEAANNYIFITGTGRCGTTLTRSLIDGCSKINVFPGEITNYLGVFLREGAYSRKLYIRNIDRVLSHFLGVYRNDTDFKQFEEKITQKIEQLISDKNVFLTACQLLNHICDTVFTSKSNIVLVDVTNENISGYLDEFPNSKVIHLIRHPMEQMNSHYRFRFADANKSFSGAFPGKWEFGDAFCRVYKSFREAQMHKNNNRVLILKLENLQLKTRDTVNEIFKFIGVNPEWINYRITRRGKNSDAGSTQKATNKVFISKSDWTCLSKNDKYVLGKISKVVRGFYDIPEYEYARNKYSTFLLRQLGFIGKNRIVVKSPIKAAKIIVVSLSQYTQDICKKFYFQAEVDTYTKGYGHEEKEKITHSV